MGVALSPSNNIYYQSNFDKEVAVTWYICLIGLTFRYMLLAYQQLQCGNTSHLIPLASLE
jgi:hypothetical protein